MTGSSIPSAGYPQQQQHHAPVRQSSISSCSSGGSSGNRTSPQSSIYSSPSSSASSTVSACDESQQVSSSADQERTMGLTSAVLMIIGTLIGTGIFASPGPLFDSVHCTQTSFIIWAFAGVVCTIGAFAYTELGNMFPASGGDFQYLSRAYGKKMALVFGWTFITILNPIGTAGNAGVLGRYCVDVMTYFRTGTSVGIGGAGAPPNMTMSGAAGGVGMNLLNGTGYMAPHAHTPYAPGTPAFNIAAFPKEHGPTEPAKDEMIWVVRGFSVGAIVLMGLINLLFRRGGQYASNVLAIIKVAGMIMLIVIGSVQAGKNHAQSEALSIPIRETSHDVFDYVSALCFAFFAFNGFNNINLGLGELRNPERNLKLAVWIAMPFVTILFLLANFAFFSILSSYDLRHVHSLSLHAGHTVLGLPGGFLMAGTVIASALGSINAAIWAGSRLLVIMAQDNAIIPFKVGQVWKQRGTQGWAILILIVQASIHALINLDFKTFSKIYSAVGWSWYGLSVLGLLYLRKKRPLHPRPVKVYWPLAAFFVLVAFFLVVGSLTLAFMSSAKPGGKGDHEDGSRWTSVIMFGMVILFTLAVIPAYYLTGAYNRWYDRKHGQRSDGEGNSLPPPEDIDDDHQGPEDSSDGNSGGATCEHGSRNGPLEFKPDGEKQPARRHSGASSVTLVDESRRQRHRQRRQQQEQQRQAIRDRAAVDSTPCDHSKRPSRRNSLEGASVGPGLALEGFFSPSSPSAICMSPISGSPHLSPNLNHGSRKGSSSSTSSNNTATSQGNHVFKPLLGLPANRSGSRSSETTLGLESDYSCENEKYSGSSRIQSEDDEDAAHFTLPATTLPMFSLTSTSGSTTEVASTLSPAAMSTMSTMSSMTTASGSLTPQQQPKIHPLDREDEGWSLHLPSPSSSSSSHSPRSLSPSALSNTTTAINSPSLNDGDHIQQ